MTLIDTINSGGMHGGMKIARLRHTSQGPEEGKPILTPGMVGEKEGALTAFNLDSSSRPGLAIRRRIMVCQSEEEADEDVAPGPFVGLTPALLNQPSAATITSANHSHQKMDLLTKQCVVRSLNTSATTTATQDQCPPMTKSPKKTLRLFDLNKLPSVQENVWSPGSSPSSTIESADSTTHHNVSTLAMATKAADVFFNGPPPSIEKFEEEGGALAVDLGLLAPVVCVRSIEAEGLNQLFAFRKPQPWEADCADVPTPGRKRLRKLSECTGGRSGTTSMAKSWTTSDGDGGNHRDDVTETLAVSQGDAKVRRLDVVDDEALSAVAALLILSSSPRRDLPFSSNGGPSSSGRRALADSPKDEEVRREAGTSNPSRSSDLAASDSEDSSRSWGSGCSVLLRPKNKRRYRSMAEIMVQTRVRNNRRA